MMKEEKPRRLDPVLRVGTAVSVAAIVLLVVGFILGSVLAVGAYVRTGRQNRLLAANAAAQAMQTQDLLDANNRLLILLQTTDERDQRENRRIHQCIARILARLAATNGLEVRRVPGGLPHPCKVLAVVLPPPEPLPGHPGAPTPPAPKPRPPTPTVCRTLPTGSCHPTPPDPTPPTAAGRPRSSTIHTVTVGAGLILAALGLFQLRRGVRRLPKEGMK